MTNVKLCRTCRFYDNESVATTGFGTCRLSPPVLIAMACPEGVEAWGCPPVAHSGRCGKWKASDETTRGEQP